MNIPKPVMWAGLAALIGVYIFTRQTEAPPEAAHDESSHTHADGTKHQGSEHSEEEGTAPSTTPLSDPSGGKLGIVDVAKGSGAVAVPGKRLKMHYRGTLTNGKQFDSSYDRGQPFEFTLGAGEVIKGWDQGIQGMKVGGKRKLTIPGSLAYGPEGRPPTIPPNATLIFDVELLGVQ